MAAEPRPLRGLLQENPRNSENIQSQPVQDRPDSGNTGRGACSLPEFSGARPSAGG